MVNVQQAVGLLEQLVPIGLMDRMDRLQADGVEQLLEQLGRVESEAPRHCGPE